MEKIPKRWDLSDLPLPRLLFLLWREKQTGSLKVSRDSAEKTLFFKEGELAFPEALLDNARFLKSLSLKSSSSLPAGSSLIKFLVEDRAISPAELWEKMKEFLKADLLAVFDWPQAECLWEEEAQANGRQVYLLLPTLEIIRQGIRRMKAAELIQKYLPSEEAALECLFPPHLSRLRLEPHEEYFYRLVQERRKLKEIYELSALGREETQKLLYAFHCLGLIDFSGNKPRLQPGQGFSPTDLRGILEAFHQKCSYIFKYISKEIGPVALNVIEKCLEEIKPVLPASFQKIKVEAKGRIDTSFISKNNLGATPSLLWGLNEILVAEVLAVKKTLGNEHESQLVKNLEKIGGWN